MTISTTGFGPMNPNLPAELAHGRSRFADELTRLEKNFLAAVAAVEAAIAKVRRREADLADQEGDLEKSADELDMTEGLVKKSHRLGHHDDPGGRGISTIAYVVLLLVVSFFQFNVDRGSLLVLRLPWSVTEVLAASLVVISVLAAHWSGAIFRRGHHVVDPKTAQGRFEVWVGRATLVGGVLLALMVASVRGLYAGWLSGVLFAVAGVLLFLVMAFASYQHHNGAVDRRNRARRTHRHRQGVVRDADGRLSKARAAYHVSCRNLVRVTRVTVERIDQMILGALDQLLHRDPDAEPPQVPEPAWLAELRRIANGEIPSDLQLDSEARP